MSNHFFLPNPATNKRLDVRLDRTHKIQFYGLNNVYPQEQEQVRLASPLIKSSTEILEDFINGTGWEENNEMIVNELGDTVQDVLNLLSLDYAKFNGFALHINFNGTGEIESIQNIPFEYCRLGLPDDKGVVSNIVVSNNWEQDPDKLPQGTVIDTTTYSIYNPLAASSELIGGNTTGQVLYFAGLEKDKYPLTTFDAIINTGETDSAIQLYERNNVKKGFHGTTIFKYPGKLETEEDKNELKKTIDTINGPHAPGILAIAIDEDFTSDLLENIDSSSDDSLFDATLTSVLNRVLQTYKLPPALLGISPAGAVFSQAAYLESFTVFNVITRNRRDKVARIMNSLTELWFEGSFNLGRILENQFNIQGVTTQEVSDKVTTTGAAIEGAEPEATEGTIEPKEDA